MQYAISKSEIDFVIDLLKEIRNQEFRVEHFSEEIEQAEELLEGVVTRGDKEQQQKLEEEHE